jgi:Fe2+ or Zn2+ uptake regulation protein
MSKKNPTEKNQTVSLLTVYRNEKNWKQSQILNRKNSNKQVVTIDIPEAQHIVI